jgi:hypothetical protein
MNAKRLTVQRVMMTLVLLVSALLGMAPLPAPRAAHAAPTPPPGSWPFYRYDMQRTNRVPSAVAKGNITQPAIKWTFPVGGGPQAWAHDITGPGGQPDGVPEIIAYGGGRVRAFNSQTGDPLWTSELLLGLRYLPFVGDVDGNGSVEVLAQTTADPKWQIHVLSGATGQTISRISGESSDPYPFLVVDANNDAKVELFESSGGDTNRQIISFQNGATSPQVIANNMPNMARMPVISNMNSDQFKEILYAEESNPGVLKIVNPSTWMIANSFTINPSSYYPNILAIDILTSFVGDEIVSIWTDGFLALHRVGSAPSYPITQQWLRSVSGVGSFGAGTVVAPNLDGVGDREIVWSYYNVSSD